MSCSNPFYISTVTNYFGEIVPLPCGCCLSCRIDKRSLWESRLKYEWTKNRSAFVRLSYDDFHLPFGTDGLYPSLRRSDVHKFLDALRHKVKYLYDTCSPLLTDDVKKGIRPDFKYFCVGEYGEDKGRPHYHVIFFGLDFQQARKLIQSTWTKGFTDIRPLKSGGIRYVLKYIDKGLSAGYTRVMQYDRFCIERPKILCSKGIGSGYFLENLDSIKKTGCVKIGQKYISIPNYYKNKYLDYSAQGLYDYLQFQADRKKTMIANARLFGYHTVDDYMIYKRIEKEKSLYSRARREGKCIERTSEYIGNFSEQKKRLSLAYRQKHFDDKYFRYHPHSYYMDYLKRCVKFGL